MAIEIPRPDSLVEEAFVLERPNDAPAEGFARAGVTRPEVDDLEPARRLLIRQDDEPGAYHRLPIHPAALSEHIGTEPHTRLRYFCSPHHQDSALYPFIVQLERAAGFARDDAVEAKLGKLRALLVPSTRDDDDIALLSELLSLPSSAADLNLSPQRRREKLFDAMLSQLEAESRHRAVLMVFEDAHWIDPTSRELLDLTVDRVRRLPVLLVVTFRPEFQHAWGGQPHVTMLALNRLRGGGGAAVVARLRRHRRVPPQRR